MKKILCTLILFGAFSAHSAQDIFLKTKNFYSWLNKNENSFASCEPSLSGQQIKLCDSTVILVNEIQKMFRSQPEELVKMIRSKGVKVRIFCSNKGTSKKKTIGEFSGQCEKNFDEKLFKKTKSLHGRYLPEKKTILIRDTSTRGSLIHEYIHYLQSENKNPIYGRVYKNTRNQLQAQLTAIMDKKIKIIGQKKTTIKNQTETSKHLKEFMTAVNGMKGFGKWQDLIDERGIFQVYLRFGKKLGVAESDIALARKNMRFICRRKDLKSLLPKAQCTGY